MSNAPAHALRLPNTTKPETTRLLESMQKTHSLCQSHVERIARQARNLAVSRQPA